MSWRQASAAPTGGQAAGATARRGPGAAHPQPRELRAQEWAAPGGSLLPEVLKTKPLPGSLVINPLTRHQLFTKYLSQENQAEEPLKGDSKPILRSRRRKAPITGGPTCTRRDGSRGASGVPPASPSRWRPAPAAAPAWAWAPSACPPPPASTVHQPRCSQNSQPETHEPQV